MPIVDESKQNKEVNNNTQNKQMAIDMEYYNRLNYSRFKSLYFGTKYQQRITPVRTLNGIRDVFVDNRGTIKQGGHTNSKLYNYSNKNRNHLIKVTYAREVDSWNNNLDFGDNGVDAAGHLVQEGISNSKKVHRAQDIWKFNPNEYKQKWSSYDLDSKAVLGLKILDKLGTPVIVRTPWLYR